MVAAFVTNVALATLTMHKNKMAMNILNLPKMSHGDCAGSLRDEKFSNPTTYFTFPPNFWQRGPHFFATLTLA